MKLTVFWIYMKVPQVKETFKSIYKAMYLIFLLVSWEDAAAILLAMLSQTLVAVAHRGPCIFTATNVADASVCADQPSRLYGEQSMQPMA